MELDELFGDGDGAIREFYGCIFRFEVHECVSEPPWRRRSGL
jgi:hypothetical protein